ncbi:uncharacterized protein LOC141614688 [Silene latifolia]|uniref:uncharacterized protein LOC141614688 n=1 Tax=Silene latifolia TaxID=37657 RepID=UPI003D774BA0
MWLDLNNSHLASLQVSDLFDQNGKWNANLISTVFKEEWSSHILAIPPCALRVRDKVYWPFTKNGAFTVKSGYGLIFHNYMAARSSIKDRSRINDRGREFCRKTLWKLPVPEVWKILIWKIIVKALPIGGEFLKRKLDIEPFCGMCGEGLKCVESMEHLFRDCSLIQRLWATSDLGIRVESAEGLSVTEWIYDWMRYFSKSEGGEAKMITFMAILWGVWSLRNRVIFQDLDLNPMTITGCFFSSIRRNIQVLSNSHPTHSAQTKLQSSVEVSSQEDREAIPIGHPVKLIGNNNACGVVRVKVDASWLRNFEEAVGWIALDQTGKEIARRQVHTRAESALQAEALGVRDVVSWAQDQRILHLAVLSDCLQLINQVAGIDNEDHLIAGILEDVRDRFSFFHCLSLSFIPRSLNSIAHGLAKQALRL